MNSFRMLSYKLRLGMIAVNRSAEQGEARIICIPADALLEISGSKLDSGLVDASWNGKTVSIFAQDLQARGDLVLRASA